MALRFKILQKCFKRLVTFEKKVLWRIFDPILEGSVWNSQENREFGGLCKGLDIIVVIRSRQLRWLGHVHRNGNTMIKRIWKKACTEWDYKGGREYTGLTSKKWPEEARSRSWDGRRQRSSLVSWNQIFNGPIIGEVFNGPRSL